MSAEYIMSGGNENLMLCERGIRTFETFTRNTLDVSAVPVLKELSHLPVVIDPSHAAGLSRLVEPLSLSAVAAGCDALMKCCPIPLGEQETAVACGCVEAPIFAALIHIDDPAVQERAWQALTALTAAALYMSFGSYLGS